MIEIPKGESKQYEFDKEKKLLKFDRMLFSPVHYPSDYGFIIDTFSAGWRFSRRPCIGVGTHFPRLYHRSHSCRNV